MSNLDEQKIDQLFLTISYINSLEQLLICLETSENSKLEIKKNLPGILWKIKNYCSKFISLSKYHSNRISKNDRIKIM